MSLTTRERFFKHGQQIRPDDIRAARQAYRNETTQACVNAILHKIYAGKGLLAYQDRQELTPSDQFTDLLKNGLEPFTRQALTAYYILGVIPVILRPSTSLGFGKDNLIPEVPAFGTYILYTNHKQGRQVFTAEAASRLWTDDEPDPNDPMNDIRVYTFLDKSPDLDGRLNSDMSVIARKLEMYAKIEQFAVRAEQHNSLPTMASEYVPPPAVGTSKSAEGLYAGDACATDESDQLTFRRTASQQRSYEQQLVAHARMNGLDPRAVYGIDPNDVMPDTERAQTRVTPLCEELWREGEVARQRNLRPIPNAHPRTDFVQINEMVREAVCDVMRVPKIVLSGDSSARLGGAELAEQTLVETAMSLAEKLADVVTELYRELVEDDDVERYVRTAVFRKRLRGKTASATPDDVAEGRRRYRVTFGFDMMPVGTAEQMYDLYLKGVIDWCKCSTTLLRMHHLHRTFEPCEVDPLSADTKREFLLGRKRKAP